jgi:hypothetical protein
MYTNCNICGIDTDQKNGQDENEQKRKKIIGYYHGSRQIPSLWRICGAGMLQNMAGGILWGIKMAKETSDSEDTFRVSSRSDDCK